MEFTLTLKPEELDLVMTALGKMPLEAVLPLYFKVKNQAEEQMKPQEQEPERQGL